MRHQQRGEPTHWRWVLVALALLTGCASAPSSAISPLRTATPYPSPTPHPTAMPRPRMILAPTPTAEPAALTATSQPASPITFDGEAAYRHIEELSISIGARPAGDAGEGEAAAYIADYLATVGYTVTRQPVPITIFRDRGSTLTYDSGTRRLWPLPMLYSGTGQVAAPLIDAGLGRPEDFRDASARGAIALVGRGGGLTFRERVRHARAAGALGVIIANDQDGIIHGSVTEAVDLPVVGISRVDGLRLRRRLAAGAMQVRLTVDATTESGQSFNVTGTRPVDDVNRPILVIGAHYDAAVGPGANVNASGVGVLLELARRLAAEQRADLRFVAFGASQVGQAGSRAYVDQLPPEERSRIVAMIEVTAVGVGPVLGVSGHEDLAAHVAAAGDQLGLTVTQPVLPAGDDHLSFNSAGIPAVAIYRLASARDRAIPDRAQFVSIEALRTVGALCLRAIDRLVEGEAALGPVAPAGVRIGVQPSDETRPQGQRTLPAEAGALPVQRTKPDVATDSALATPSGHRQLVRQGGRHAPRRRCRRHQDAPGCDRG